MNKSVNYFIPEVIAPGKHINAANRSVHRSIGLITDSVSPFTLHDDMDQIWGAANASDLYSDDDAINDEHQAAAANLSSAFDGILTGMSEINPLYVKPLFPSLDFKPMFKSSRSLKTVLAFQTLLLQQALNKVFDDMTIAISESDSKIIKCLHMPVAGDFDAVNRIRNWVEAYYEKYHSLAYGTDSYVSADNVSFNSSDVSEVASYLEFPNGSIVVVRFMRYAELPGGVISVTDRDFTKHAFVPVGGTHSDFNDGQYVNSAYGGNDLVDLHMYGGTADHSTILKYDGANYVPYGSGILRRLFATADMRKSFGTLLNSNVEGYYFDGTDISVAMTRMTERIADDFEGIGGDASKVLVHALNSYVDSLNPVELDQKIMKLVSIRKPDGGYTISAVEDNGIVYASTGIAYGDAFYESVTTRESYLYLRSVEMGVTPTMVVDDFSEFQDGRQVFDGLWSQSRCNAKLRSQLGGLRYHAKFFVARDGLFIAKYEGGDLKQKVLPNGTYVPLLTLL